MEPATNHLTINEFYFKNINNNNFHKINRIINLIVNENRECFFDTDKTRLDFISLLNKIKLSATNEIELVSKIDTIFQKILNPVNMIPLTTVLPDQTEYKIEISKECLANCFEYFKGKFHVNSQATIITIDPPISRESLDSLAAHVIGRDWKFSNIQIVDEMLALAHLYNEDHFSEQVALKALDFLATKGNEKDFNDRYVKGCEKVFLDKYFSVRGAKHSHKNHVDIGLEDFITMTSTSDNLVLFLRQQSPSIRLIIEENFDPVSVLLLPDEFLDLISAFVFTPGEGIGWGFSLEDYKKIQDYFPTKNIYPLLNSKCDEEKLDPFSWVLYSAYIRHQEGEYRIVQLSYAYFTLNNDSECRDLILKEVTRCILDGPSCLSQTLQNKFINELSKFPNNPYLLTLIGINLIKKKEMLDQAVNYLTKSLQQDPKNILTLHAFADCLNIQAHNLITNKQEGAFNKLVEVEEYCRKGLKLQPTHIKLLEHLIISLNFQAQHMQKKEAFDKYSEVEEYCRKGLKLQPTNLNFLRPLVKILEEHGLHCAQRTEAFKKYSEAEKYCREGLDLHPTDPTLLEVFILSLIMQFFYFKNINKETEAINKLFEAEKYSYKGLELQPNHIKFLNYLVKILLNQSFYFKYINKETEAFNKLFEAEKYSHKGLELQPNNIIFFDYLVQILFYQSFYFKDTTMEALNKLCKAEEYSHKVLELQPNNITFLNHLLAILRWQGVYLQKNMQEKEAFEKYIEAEKYSRQALKEYPSEVIFRVNLVSSLDNEANYLIKNKDKKPENQKQALLKYKEVEKVCRESLQDHRLDVFMANSLLNQAKYSNYRSHQIPMQLLVEAEMHARKHTTLLLGILLEQLQYYQGAEKEKKIKECQKYYAEILKTPDEISPNILGVLKKEMEMINSLKRHGSTLDHGPLPKKARSKDSL